MMTDVSQSRVLTAPGDSSLKNTNQRPNMKTPAKGLTHQLTAEVINEFRNNFLAKKENELFHNACSKMDPLEFVFSRSRMDELNFAVFTHKVDPEGKPMTNQKSSGRCWIFALLNVMRQAFMKKYNLEEFEFSQSHLFFYDKLERCNYFLNSVYETYLRGEQVNGRLVSFILENPTNDGGQWDMLVNLIIRYGIVPKKNFSESFSSESSNKLNNLLKAKLREFCKEIRDFMDKNKTHDEVAKLIRAQMEQIYKIIVFCLGAPKDKIVWEYYDKNKKFNKVGPITPLAFYDEYVKPVFDIEDKVCLINDPRPTNDYGKLYTVDCLGNVVGGRRTIYNNQPIEILEQVTAESIKAGQPVWFGCDVTKRFAFKQGVQDLDIHDFETLFGFEVGLGMSKADRLIYGDSMMTHAMVFTAISQKESGEIEKLRVENSWGDDRSGEKGYLLMTGKWFKEFVFEVVVDKSYVPQTVLDVFNMEPIILPAWDPMGALACKDCSKEEMG